MSKHSTKNIAQAATLFFIVRGLVRSKLAQGRKLDPYAWLRIETLVFIRDHEGPSMKDIAEHLSITAPSTTSLISALVRAGFVSYAKNAADRRAKRIYLTKKGSQLLARTIAVGMHTLGELFSVLSSSELAAFSHALKRIKEGTEE